MSRRISGQVSNWDRGFTGLPGAGFRPVNTSGAQLTGSGLFLPGVISNKATSPDSAALDITGDIEFFFRLSLDLWINSNNQSLLQKFATSNQSYRFYISANSGSILAQFSTTGSNTISASSTVAPGFSPGDTKWLRVTRVASTGAVDFYTAADSTTVPTSWTQLGTTVTATSGNLFAGNAILDMGDSGFGLEQVKGVYYQAIINNGIGGTTVFDANFATQTADALAFTESSANAATVSIATTRYTYGLPNVQWSTSNATQALSANTVYYQPFLVSAPIIVDGTQFHVTSGPASAANVRTGIYLADANGQPSGAPIIDTGNVAVGTSVTGTFFTQITPVTLQPGIYLTAFNTSVALTTRVVRGGIVGIDVGNATTSNIISLMSATQTQGTFPNPGTSWKTRTFSNTSPNHFLFLRWSPA
jgi:hypothetical protein